MNFNRLLKNAPRKHKLLTKELEKKLPALYTNEKISAGEQVAIVKYFTPASSWTWYATEYGSEDRVFFGLVVGHDVEFGYFSLDELEECGGMVERDLYFSPTKLKDLPGEAGRHARGLSHG